MASRNYTEGEIKTAVTAAFPEMLFPDASRQVLKELRKLQAEHLFSDDDLISVRELRQAITRMFPDGKCAQCGAALAVAGVADGTAAGRFLHEISYAREQAREPAYVPMAVYRDAHGCYWQRAYGSAWRSFGTGLLAGHEAPARPLEKMP